MPARKKYHKSQTFFFVYKSTISNACKKKHHKSQTFFSLFTNLQFQMPARKNITRAKHFFFCLQIYNFKCLQEKYHKSQTFFFIYKSTISNACKKNITRAKHFFSFTNLQFQMPARKISQEPNIFFHLQIYNFKCLQENTLQFSNVFVSVIVHKKFKKNTKESFSSIFGYSPRL